VERVYIFETGKITFQGEAKILLEDKGTKIFLDFGMSFGRRGKFFEEFNTGYKRNL